MRFTNKDIENIVNKANLRMGIKPNKFKFVSTTNLNFKSYEGNIYDTYIDGLILHIIDTRFRSSYIVKCSKDGDTLTINTRNSVYVIKALDVKCIEHLSDGELFSLTEHEQNNLECYLQSLYLGV